MSDTGSKSRQAAPPPEAATQFNRLLGLGAGRRGSAWRVTAADADGASAIKLRLDNGNDQLHVRIDQEPGDDGEGSAAWALSIEDQWAAQWAASLVDGLARRLRGRSFQQLLGTARGDLEPSTPPTTTPAAEAGSFPLPDFDMAAGEQQQGWANFFCADSIAMQMDLCLQPGAGFHAVILADRECFYSSFPTDARLYCHVDFPGITLMGETMSPATLLGFGDRGSKTFTAELEEPDVILGTAAKARQLVEQVGAEAPAAEVFNFTHMCTPTVMGEDLELVGRQIEKATNAKVLHTSQLDLDRRVGLAGRIFSALATPPNGALPEPDPRAVNLLDFSPRFCDEELIPQLTALDLRVNCRLFPEVDPAVMQRFAEAGTNLLPRHGLWETRLTSHLKALPRTLLAVDAPYGIEGTKRCLQAIAAGLDRSATFDAAWLQLWEPRQARWEALISRARQQRLAFVVTPRTLSFLDDPAHWWGLRMLDFLIEGGFGVDLLLYAPGLSAAEVESAAASLTSKPGVAAQAFETRAQLDEQLEAGSFAAVYSDFGDDWRPMRAGKALFSRRLVEPGVGGAIRSVEALLKRCETPFYRRYAAHVHDGAWTDTDDVS